MVKIVGNHLNIVWVTSKLLLLGFINIICQCQMQVERV